MKASLWVLLLPDQVSRGCWRITPHRSPVHHRTHSLTHTFASVGGNWGKPTKVTGEEENSSSWLRPPSCRQMCAGAEGLESSERGHAEITAFRPYGREYDHLFDKIKAGLDEAQPGLISESSPLRDPRDATMFGRFAMIRRPSVRFCLLTGPGCSDWKT